MKRHYNIYVYLLMLLASVASWAQQPYDAPRLFSIQAVVRQANGELYLNGDVAMQVNIRRDGEAGVIVYSEAQQLRTNNYGTLSATIGTASAIDRLDWGNHAYFMELQLTPDGGETLRTVQRMQSVPYALNVAKTDSVRNRSMREQQVLTMRSDTVFLTGGSYVVLPAHFDGLYSSLRNVPNGIGSFANDAGYLSREVQVLSLRHDTLFLTGGSFVKLPSDFSGNYNDLTNKPTALSRFTNNVGYITREVQVLSLGHDTIFLTGGSFVKIPRLPELQNFAAVLALGNSAAGRQLKNLKDPTDSADALTFHYLDSALRSKNIDILDRGTHNVFVREACDGYNWHGTWVTQSGVYTHSYSNSLGFYSVDSLLLTVRHSSHRTEDVVTVGSYRWHGTTYTQSDRYVYHYVNDEGCESHDTLNLRLLSATECEQHRLAADTAVLEACGTAVWHGRHIQISGEYEQALGHISVFGCDSVVHVTIQVHPMFKSDTVVRAQGSFAWRGHAYTTQGDYYDTLRVVGGCDSVYGLHLVVNSRMGIGASRGNFSVAPGLQVNFARGNLQYLPSQKLWRFAPEQYEMRYLQDFTENYSAWCDRFGWGTSGYHDPQDSLNTCYEPWHTSNILAADTTVAYRYNRYGYGPSTDQAERNLTGANAAYDWGMYNSISNGGGEDSLWRVLSAEEWNYLLYGRPNAANLRLLCIIDSVEDPIAWNGIGSVYGLMILPDDWVQTPQLWLLLGSQACYQFALHVSEWKEVEEAGAVFLPLGNGHYNEGMAFYWSSTAGDAGSAYCLALADDAHMVAPYNRSNGNFVRLVQTATSGSEGCQPTTSDTTVVAAGPYRWGDSTYTVTGDYYRTILNRDGCDSLMTLSLIVNESGVLPGLFSVGDSTKVAFSKGNLQYKASANVWRLAPTQYDYCSGENEWNVASYDHWTDLFGWATSGYHDSSDVLNRYYRPWDWGEAQGYGPSVNMPDWNLTGTSAHYDWGVHNAIGNGGGVAGRWRTLSSSEWLYLLADRADAYALSGIGTVCGVRGIILLPDSCQLPTGLTFTPGFLSPERPRDSYLYNVYSPAQWRQMEQVGAVFLPAAGILAGFNVLDISWGAYYWTSSGNAVGYNDSWTSSAQLLMVGIFAQLWNNEWFYGPMMNSFSKQYRCAVRLVQDRP